MTFAYAKLLCTLNDKQMRDKAFMKSTTKHESQIGRFVMLLGSRATHTQNYIRSTLLQFFHRQCPSCFARFCLYCCCCCNSLCLYIDGKYAEFEFCSFARSLLDLSLCHQLITNEKKNTSHMEQLKLDTLLMCLWRKAILYRICASKYAHKVTHMSKRLFVSMPINLS